MYVKRSTRRTADGTTVGYLQLAHNEWDVAAKVSRTKVLYSFGREDQLERVERILFALVANRALAPSSKLAATRWIERDTVIDGLDVPIVDESCYRAMDWLIDAEPELGRIVFDNTADLLNLEADLLFFDTTSTYFETEDADEPVGRDERGMPVAGGEPAVKEAGFRTFGKSKDSRGDLPQIVVGMAVSGIPVRCWVEAYSSQGLEGGLESFTGWTSCQWVRPGLTRFESDRISSEYVSFSVPWERGSDESPAVLVLGT